MTGTIPGLGTLVNVELDWLASEPVEVPGLGTHCRFFVDSFEPAETARLSESVQAFRALSAVELRGEAADHVWAHYRDFAAHCGREPGFPAIPGSITCGTSSPSATRFG